MSRRRRRRRRRRRNSPSTSPYILKVWCLVKHREFTLPSEEGWISLLLLHLNSEYIDITDP